MSRRAKRAVAQPEAPYVSLVERWTSLQLENHGFNVRFVDPDDRALDILNDPVMWRAVVVPCSDEPSQFEVLLVNVYVDD